MDKEEEGLVNRARGGDEAAFSELVRRYQDRLYGMARQACSGLKGEMDDVAQETMISAFKNMDKFRGQSAFGTWLYRIAANNCWMRHRKRRREKLVSLEELLGSKEFAAPDENIKTELSAGVAKALAALPLDFRMAITLADVQGLTMDEAARALGITVPAFKTRLFRARQRLKKELE